MVVRGGGPVWCPPFPRCCGRALNVDPAAALLAHLPQRSRAMPIFRLKPVTALLEDPVWVGNSDRGTALP